MWADGQSLRALQRTTHQPRVYTFPHSPINGHTLPQHCPHHIHCPDPHLSLYFHFHTFHFHTFHFLTIQVHAGIIGRTLSSFGLVGLYTVFVYGISRFLRLSLSNLHQRIPFRFLPNTRYLVALVQVGCRVGFHLCFSTQLLCLHT